MWMKHTHPPIHPHTHTHTYANKGEQGARPGTCLYACLQTRESRTWLMCPEPLHVQVQRVRTLHCSQLARCADDATLPALHTHTIKCHTQADEKAQKREWTHTQVV